MASLQANQHFLFPALAPTMYNVGQIFGAVFLVLSGYFFYTNLGFFVLMGGMDLPRGFWQYQFLDLQRLLLVFDELSVETVLETVRALGPDGVIVCMGGQTANNLVPGLARANVRILGTPASQIDRAENRGTFSALCDELAIAQPRWVAHGSSAVPVPGVAAAGAFSRVSMKKVCPVLARWIIMKPPPPTPADCGSTTLSA